MTSARKLAPEFAAGRQARTGPGVPPAQTADARVASAARTAYINARLLDPPSGLDAPGALLTEGSVIEVLTGNPPPKLVKGR